jgi:hypothetical protein
MEHTTANTVCVPVPQEDGAIERAFADFEAKLAALTNGLQEAQAAIRNMAARPVESAPTVPSEQRPVVESDRVIVEPVEALSPAPASANATTADVAKAKPAGTPPAHAPSKAERVSAASAAKPQKDEPAHATSAPIAVPPVDPIPSAPADAPKPAVDEDEALLATLDEETANAIRVMRRMSMGKKTVRELLEKYQKSHASQQAASKPKKQSWWR